MFSSPVRRGRMAGALGFVLLAGVGVVGCASAGSDRMAAALSVRHTLSPAYQDALLVLDEQRLDSRNLKDYALWGMCGAAVAICAGDTYDAARIGRDTFLTVQKYEDKNAEVLATLGNEGGSVNSCVN